MLRRFHVKRCCALAAVVVLAGPAAAEAKRFVGTSDPDQLSGTRRGDALLGRNGNDVLRGQGGDDRLLGGNGADAVYGGRGDDRLDGEAGSDLLYGGRGADLLDGGAHPDLLDGGPGRDRLIGRGGTDRFVAGAGNDRIDARDGRAGERVTCGSGRDYVYMDVGDRKDADCETSEVFPIAAGAPAQTTPPPGSGTGPSVSPVTPTSPAPPVRPQPASSPFAPSLFDQVPLVGTVWSRDDSGGVALPAGYDFRTTFTFIAPIGGVGGGESLHIQKTPLGGFQNQLPSPFAWWTNGSTLTLKFANGLFGEQVRTLQFGSYTPATGTLVFADGETWSS